MKSDSLRNLIAYAAIKDWDINHYDVETAFLYGSLREDIYMEQPPGFIQEHENKILVCKLKQAIYGLKQSGRVWYETLNKYLEKCNLKKFKSDPCIFRYKKENSELMLGLHVDDMIIINSDNDILDEVIRMISKQFKLKRSDNLNNILGIEINITPDIISMNQQKFIEEILRRFKMSDCHSVSTPIDINQNLDNCKDSKLIDSKKYQEILGSIMYIMTKTRPDLAYAISVLSKYSKEPHEIHMTALKRILRYLKGTRDYALNYKKGSGSLKCFVDANWRDGHEGQRSTSGYLFMFGQNLISWTSKTQTNVSLSTCDSELSALTEAIKRGIYLQVFLKELCNLKDDIIKTPVYCDNKSAISLGLNGATSNRSNHMIRKVAFINEQINNNFFDLEYVNTNEQLADFLTKALSKPKLHKILNELNLSTQIVGESVIQFR